MTESVRFEPTMEMAHSVNPRLAHSGPALLRVVKRLTRGATAGPAITSLWSASCGTICCAQSTSLMKLPLTKKLPRAVKKLSRALSIEAPKLSAFSEALESVAVTTGEKLKGWTGTGVLTVRSASKLSSQAAPRGPELKWKFPPGRWKSIVTAGVEPWGVATAASTVPLEARVQLTLLTPWPAPLAA